MLRADPTRLVKMRPYIIAFTSIAVPLLLTLISGWYYAGPYRFFAELQVRAWGTEYVQLSAGATFLVFLPAVVLPLAVLRWRFVPGALATGAKAARSAVVTPVKAAEVAVICIGILLLGFGGWAWVLAVTAGPLTEYSIGQAERGIEAKSRYVFITDARPIPGYDLRFTRDDRTEYYFPVESGQGGDGLLHVFIQLSNSAWPEQPATALTGELVPDGLPGALRVSLEEKSLMASRHFVLHPGRNPADDATFFGWMSVIGALFLAVGILGVKMRLAETASGPSAPDVEFMGDASPIQRFLRWTVRTRWWFYPFNRRGLLLTLILPFPVLAATQFLVDAVEGARFYSTHSWPKYLGFTMIGISLSVVGYFLNRRESEFHRLHRALWVPLEYSVAIYAAIALLVAVL